MHLDHLITQLEASSGQEDLRRAMSREIAELDIQGFIYLNRNMHKFPTQLSEHILLSSVAGQSVDHYFKNILPWFDGIIARAAMQHLPFFWGPTEILCTAGEAQEMVVQDPPYPPELDTRICYGWTVPVHDAMGRIAAMSFTGSRDFDPFRDKIDANKATLHAMTIYFHAYICKAVGLRTYAPTAKLTPRERQCLEWAAHGKSRTDIGQIIGLSPRTVKFHLENAQRKLNVARTTQAVLRAALLGLITLPEEY